MIAAVAALCLAAAPAELEYQLKADVPITLGLAAWWLTSEYAFKEDLAPLYCRWCARNGLDDAARAIRAPLERQRAAIYASDIVGLAAAPVVTLGTEAVIAWLGGGTWRDGLVDALLIVEAMMASQALNQAVKFIASRERPFVAALPEDEKPRTSQPHDNNLSFFSGHTAFTFSLVAAGATIARARGYRYWWVVLAVGLPFAATTATLRMVADKHYLTDVLTGATLGLLIGWGVPTLFHRPVRVGEVTASLAVAPGGIGVEGTW